MAHPADPTNPRRGSTLTLVLVALVTIGLGVVVWEEGLEDRATFKNLSEVGPDLYRSGQLTRFTVGPALRRLQPDHIVVLGSNDKDDPNHVAERAAAASLGIPQSYHPLAGDGLGDPYSYVSGLAKMHEVRQRGERVLVHCWAGSERTGGFVALYRTLFHGHPADEAVAEMHRFGHDDDETVLIDYLNENVGLIASSLVDLGVLAAVPDPLPVFPRPE
jgi:hypothetical protein